MTKNMYEIKANNNKGDYEFKAFFPREELTFVNENHVFDENKTIKENREMAAKHNELVREKRMSVEKAKKGLKVKFRNDIVEALINEYKMTKAQAIFLEKHVNEEDHDGLLNYIYAIEELADFVTEFVNLHNVEK